MAAGAIVSLVAGWFIVISLYGLAYGGLPYEMAARYISVGCLLSIMSFMLFRDGLRVQYDDE